MASVVRSAGTGAGIAAIGTRTPWLAPAVFRGKLLEQQLIVDFFDSGVGTFVEVGANDPVEGSLTWRLEQAGWGGLLVEPLSEHADRLRRERKANVAEVACGAPEHDGATMDFRVAGPLGVQSTLAADFATPGVAAREVRKVAATTLDSLLRKFSIDRVDFLSIDVEGFEPEVLRGFSIRRYMPSLVLLEDRVRNLRLHRHMLASGYRVIRRIGQNAWYVPVEVDFPISPYGRLQLWKKYYLGLPLRRLKHRLASARAKRAGLRHRDNRAQQ